MNVRGSDHRAFKRCTCGTAVWETRADFLADASVQLVGYQVSFEQLELGFFLFNHLACRSTIAIEAGSFWDLHDGPAFSERLTGSDECPGHCLYEDDLEPCPAMCECAYVREVMHSIRRWPKS